MAGVRKAARRAALGVTIMFAVLSSGCSTSRFLAKRFLQAPNTYPSWVGPTPRVLLELPGRLATHLPARTIEVGPPAARLHARLVEPGDYQLQMNSTVHETGSRRRLELTLRATTPARPLAGAVHRPRGTVFLLHGYGVSLESMVPWALVLAEQNYRVVLLDLRGHGRSTGRRFYCGTVEARDMRQVLDALETAGSISGPVAVMGDSFGAALALRWAADDPRLATVIALAPYAELLPAVMGLRDEYAPWLPRGLVRRSASRFAELLQVQPEHLDTVGFVARVRVPTMFVAAGSDRIAPAKSVATLARACGGPSKYLVVEAAQHETLPFHFNELREVVVNWLEQHLQPDVVRAAGLAGPRAAR